jgi:RNA polymerase sigma-70 factor (ECF subfamily)
MLRRRDTLWAVDDFALLDRWRNGDRHAGEQLCARYFDEIYRFFVHKLADEAEDLTQRTFLACVQSRDRFRAQSSFRTYLFAIAHNELLMELRRRAKVEHVDLSVSSLADLASTPTQRLGKHQERERLRAALARLPLEQQLLLEFRYWHELDAGALAELHETTPGAIRVRLVRARKALRALLGGALDEADASDPLSTSLREPDEPDEPDDPAGRT